MKRTITLLAAVAVIACCGGIVRAKTTAEALKEKKPKAYNFLVVGDWGSNGQLHQQQVADAMGTYNMDFGGKSVVSVGDNFYCCGVASVDDPQWMSSFENVYRNHSLQIDWFSILGNHDYKGNPQAEIDYTRKSRRWVMPARYYTTVQKIDASASVRFVFLDTDPFITDYQKKAAAYSDLAAQHPDEQLAWLDSVLRVSKESWKIVVGHHPVYSSGSEHGDTPELIAKLKPILEKYHVDAYFCGHEHDLQHQKAADGGVNYFVSGAGSEVRPNGTTATTKFSAATAGFMAVSVTQTTMAVKVISEKGKVLYHTEITK